MALQVPLEILGQQTMSLQERIEGTPTARVISEFVTTSALFPVLDAIQVISVEGWGRYLSEPAHYILFLAAFIQAWFLGTVPTKRWSTIFFGNLLGFALYAPIDIAIEGLRFFQEPYHLVFGGFSLLMAVTGVLQHLARQTTLRQIFTSLLANVSRVLLLPTIYMISEMHLELPSQFSWAAFVEYMQHSGHRFILFSVIFFGILLGLGEAQRLVYLRVLRLLAEQLKKYSAWSLGEELITTALDNPEALQLHRVERTILFMDIRGFTAWTESSEPQYVVDMLNRYYREAEAIIQEFGGHKPSFTADEIMTRFAHPEPAFAAAQALQVRLAPLLAEANLAVGVGLHTGEVIEGLMGSETTRKYDIIGDAVNTAKRLESSAGRGEIVISADTFRRLPAPPADAPTRSLRVKGKTDPLTVYVVTPEPAVSPSPGVPLETA